MGRAALSGRAQRQRQCPISTYVGKFFCKIPAHADSDVERVFEGKS
jgi:hypothetical protein